MRVTNIPLRNAGLSMVETLIMVIVMAIMMGVAVPPMALYIKDHKDSLEQETLLEIQEAMQVFANNFNRLPDDTDTSKNTYCNTTNNTWNECLALYSNLSAKQIAEDIWGYPRTYIMTTNTEKILGEDIEVFYASIHSYGPNHKADELDKNGMVVNGIAVNTTNNTFYPAGHANWWTSNILEFNDLTPGFDDHVIKFSDLMYKVEKFNSTNSKLEAITEALDNYSTVHKERLVIGMNTVNNQIVFTDEMLYVPPATTNTADTANYADEIITDMQTYSVTGAGVVYGANMVDCNLADCTAEVNTWDANTSTYLRYKCSTKIPSGVPYNCTVAVNKTGPQVRLSNLDSTPANKQQRLADMIKLMRILGLPDSFCCSDLEREPDAKSPKDYTQGRPFFYYSNPRPIVGNTCQARPTKADVMPPVIQATPRTTENGTPCD